MRFIPREQALKELQAAEGLAEVVAALNRNPLPDAFVVRPKATDAETLDALARELRAVPAVAHVQVDSAWARRLGALARNGAPRHRAARGAARLRPGGGHLQHHPAADPHPARRDRGVQADRRHRRLHPPAVLLPRRCCRVSPAGCWRWPSSGAAWRRSTSAYPNWPRATARASGSPSSSRETPSRWRSSRPSWDGSGPIYQ